MEMKYNMNKIKYGYVDILKFIFSICIIIMHTGLLYSTSPTINWYLTHLLLRLAVPFFFITSGFFYGRKILAKNKEIKKITRKYITKLFYPFIFWLCISLPVEFIDTHEGNILRTILILIKKTFFYPWGALWYILALMVAVLVLSKFYKKNKFYLSILIGFFLYTFALICNSYYFLVIDRPLMKSIVDLYMKIFISGRNGIFLGIFYVSIGVILSKIQKENKLLNKKENIIMIILAYFAYAIEIYIVNHKPILDDSSLFIFLPIFIFLLVSLLIQLNDNKEYKKLRNYSIGLYLIHRPVMGYLRLLFKIDYGINLFIVTIFLAFFICYLLQKSENKFIRLITMR